MYCRDEFTIRALNVWLGSSRFSTAIRFFAGYTPCYHRLFLEWRRQTALGRKLTFCTFSLSYCTSARDSVHYPRAIFSEDLGKLASTKCFFLESSFPRLRDHQHASNSLCCAQPGAAPIQRCPGAFGSLGICCARPHHRQQHGTNRPPSLPSTLQL